MTELKDTKRHCACATIRRTDRVVTQFYDEILAPSGLNGTQFGLLDTLTEIAPITINGLAEAMTLDRTTVTRSLEVLIKHQFVQNRQGEDRRVYYVLPTQQGEQALQHARQLWQKAQARIEYTLGRERFDTLLSELEAIRILVK